MMGQKTSLPIFISPAGMAGLAHPQGERVLSSSAGECGIIQMVGRFPLALPLTSTTGLFSRTKLVIWSTDGEVGFGRGAVGWSMVDRR